MNAVANEAATVSTSIPTFVVGVGNTGNLDAIAKAGGTTAATIVSTTNPMQTATDFQNALDAIRRLTLACEYAIPAPPQGETFDENKVNVVYRPTTGTPQTLTYNQDCTGGTGWHYDDPKNPKVRALQRNVHDGSRGQIGRHRDLVGCATNGVIPN